jgi:hypothetical protein
MVTSPLSPLQHETFGKNIDIYGWRGEFRREGASPPLKFSPPLEHNKIRVMLKNLFERGIKRVSM